MQHDKMSGPLQHLRVQDPFNNTGLLGRLLVNPGVGICPHALERQTIIVSICNVECAFEPRGGCNLLYSVSCHRRC